MDNINNDLLEENKKLRDALKQITMIAGNLPDDRITEKTGPNDAVARGIMVISARQIALRALGLTEICMFDYKV